MKKIGFKIAVVCLLIVAFSSCKNEKKVQDQQQNQESLANDSIKKDSVLNQEISLKHPSTYKDVLIYTVQIGAFKKPNNSLENKEDVVAVTDNLLIKYRLGNFKTYKEAKKFKNSISTSFSDAFIVPINKGEQIDIKEALKLSNEI